MTQGKTHSFYEDFGTRIKFIRESKGITLSSLGEGKPSTAQAWEAGKQPRRERWSPIAERLGLSEAFIFLGKPETNEDYAFIRQYRDSIGPPPTTRYFRKKPTDPHRDSAPTSVIFQSRDMKVNPDYELPPDPESCLRKINDHLAPWLQAAPDDPEVAAYLLGQLRINLPHSHLDKLLEK